jgi:hypothetical protein
MKIATFPRLVKWMFLSALAFLIFMTLMRFVFFFHFRPSQYTFPNSFKAFMLGLNFDARIVCGIVLFPFLIGNLHVTYNDKRRISTGSIVQLFVTILVMVLLNIFMKKGHAPISALVIIDVLFAGIILWLLATKNCDPFEKFLKRIFLSLLSSL